MTRVYNCSRALIGGVAATLVFAAGLPAAAQSESAPDVEAKAEAASISKGEKRLAKLLKDRVAGEPVRCIRAMPSQRMQTIDRTAYVYGSGDTIYVQRTRNPDQISDNDVLVSNRTNGSELCRLDVVNTIDRILGQFTGTVFLEDFVPYTRVKS